jgi:hypothetical protein
MRVLFNRVLTIGLPPFQGGSAIGKCPGVKTPGSVLISLRDTLRTPHSPLPNPHSPIPTPQSSTPVLHHSSTPPLQYSSTPVLQYSSTPVLQYSNTPSLQYSTAPAPPGPLVPLFAIPSSPRTPLEPSVRVGARTQQIRSRDANIFPIRP